MSSPTYSFEALAFENARSALSTVNSNIEQALIDLNTNVQPELELWLGGAKEAYEECRLQWQADLQAMRSALSDRAIPSLQNVEQNYWDAERRMQGTWGGR